MIVRLPPDAANYLANHPDVIGHVARGYDRIDLAPFYAVPGNLALGDWRGGALFGRLGPGIYEGHYLFHPLTRGELVVRNCRRMLEAMFTEFGAYAIIGHTPIEDRRARALNRALGFAPFGASTSPTGRSCKDYILERSRWAILSGVSLAAWDPSPARSSRTTQPTPPHKRH